MIRLLNYYVIDIENIWDEGDGPVKKINSAYFIDQERDRYERKMRKGTIYSHPLGFTDDKFMPIDPGFPNPKIFIGHDGIQGQVNQGYEWNNSLYNPSTCDGFKYLSRADYAKKISASKGDQVWFHPRVTEPDNFLKEEGNLMLYRADVIDLILVGEQAQGSWVLISPHEEQNERNGFVLGIDGVDKMLEGTVRFTRPGSGLKVGDFVMFQENSDWQFEIDGERLYAMEEENILLTCIQ